MRRMTVVTYSEDKNMFPELSFLDFLMSNTRKSSKDTLLNANFMSASDEAFKQIKVSGFF